MQLRLSGKQDLKRDRKTEQTQCTNSNMEVWNSKTKRCLSLQEIGQTARRSCQTTERTKHFSHAAWCYYSLCFQSWCDSGCCNVGKAWGAGLVESTVTGWTCLELRTCHIYSKQLWLYWLLASAAVAVRHDSRKIKTLSWFQTRSHSPPLPLCCSVYTETKKDTWTRDP